MEKCMEISEIFRVFFNDLICESFNQDKIKNNQFLINRCRTRNIFIFYVKKRPLS